MRIHYSFGPFNVARAHALRSRDRTEGTEARTLRFTRTRTRVDSHTSARASIFNVREQVKCDRDVIVVGAVCACMRVR